MLPCRAVLAPPVKWAFKQFLMHYMYLFFKRVLYAQLTGMNTKSIRWIQIYNCLQSMYYWLDQPWQPFWSPSSWEGKCMCMSIPRKPSRNRSVRVSQRGVKLIWLIVASQFLSPQILKMLFTIFSLHYHSIICELDESYANPHSIQINSTKFNPIHSGCVTLDPDTEKGNVCSLLQSQRRDLHSE